MSLVTKRLIQNSDRWNFFMFPFRIMTIGSVTLDRLINNAPLKITVQDFSQESKLTASVKAAIANTNLTPTELNISDFRYAIRFYKKNILLCQVAIDGTKSVARVDGKEGYITGEMKKFCTSMEDLFGVQ